LAKCGVEHGFVAGDQDKIRHFIILSLPVMVPRLLIFGSGTGFSCHLRRAFFLSDQIGISKIAGFASDLRHINPT
jgi:hypothetical protein